MSRNNQRPQEEAQAIDLTPMLDVVFIMLIFFIVTATFIKETGKDVTRPDANTADDRPNASILIAVGGDNEIWMDKKKIDLCNFRQAIQCMRSDKLTVAVYID